MTLSRLPVCICLCLLAIAPVQPFNVLGTSDTKKLEQVSTGVPGLTVSEMGFGTWQWGNQLLWNYDKDSDEEIYQSYMRLRDQGATLFDTADSYGTLQLNGRAEILLGEFERRYQAQLVGGSSAGNGLLGLFGDQKYKPPPQQVATKFAPYPWRVTRGQLVTAARDSLKRLQQDKLSIAQLHWSTANYQPFQERTLWEGIADVYDAGLCDAVGVSNYGPIQLNKIATYLKEERRVPLATAQVQFSLMTYKDSQNLKKSCDDSGVRLIAYSPLCLGLLTGKYDLDNLPKSPARQQLFRELLPGARNLLNTLEAVALDVDKTQSQVAINWAICKGAVPIPGVRTVKMAEENLGAAGWRLGKDAADELERAALNLDKTMIQNIFQTK